MDTVKKVECVIKQKKVSDPKSIEKMECQSIFFNFFGSASNMTTEYASFLSVLTT